VRPTNNIPKANNKLRIGKVLRFILVSPFKYANWQIQNMRGTQSFQFITTIDLSPPCHQGLARRSGLPIVRALSVGAIGVPSVVGQHLSARILSNTPGLQANFVEFMIAHNCPNWTIPHISLGPGKAQSLIVRGELVNDCGVFSVV
jgi:hypothetical protein